MSTNKENNEGGSDSSIDLSSDEFEVEENRKEEEVEEVEEEEKEKVNETKQEINETEKNEETPIETEIDGDHKEGKLESISRFLLDNNFLLTSLEFFEELNEMGSQSIPQTLTGFFVEQQYLPRGRDGPVLPSLPSPLGVPPNRSTSENEGDESHRTNESQDDRRNTSLSSERRNTVDDEAYELLQFQKMEMEKENLFIKHLFQQQFLKEHQLNLKPVKELEEKELRNNLPYFDISKSQDEGLKLGGDEQEEEEETKEMNFYEEQVLNHLIVNYFKSVDYKFSLITFLDEIDQKLSSSGNESSSFSEELEKIFPSSFTFLQIFRTFFLRKVSSKEMTQKLTKLEQELTEKKNEVKEKEEMCSHLVEKNNEKKNEIVFLKNVQLNLQKKNESLVQNSNNLLLGNKNQLQVLNSLQEKCNQFKNILTHKNDLIKSKNEEMAKLKNQLTSYEQQMEQNELRNKAVIKKLLEEKQKQLEAALLSKKVSIEVEKKKEEDLEEKEEEKIEVVEKVTSEKIEGDQKKGEEDGDGDEIPEEEGEVKTPVKEEEEEEEKKKIEVEEEQKKKKKKVGDDEDSDSPINFSSEDEEEKNERKKVEDSETPADGEEEEEEVIVSEEPKEEEEEEVQNDSSIVSEIIASAKMLQSDDGVGTSSPTSLLLKKELSELESIQKNFIDINHEFSQSTTTTNPSIVHSVEEVEDEDYSLTFMTSKENKKIIEKIEELIPKLLKNQAIRVNKKVLLFPLICSLIRKNLNHVFQVFDHHHVLGEPKKKKKNKKRKRKKKNELFSLMNKNQILKINLLFSFCNFDVQGSSSSTTTTQDQRIQKKNILTILKNELFSSGSSSSQNINLSTVIPSSMQQREGQKEKRLFYYFCYIFLPLIKKFNFSFTNIHTMVVGKKKSMKKKMSSLKKKKKKKKKKKQQQQQQQQRIINEKEEDFYISSYDQQQDSSDSEDDNPEEDYEEDIYEDYSLEEKKGILITHCEKKLFLIECIQFFFEYFFVSTQQQERGEILEYEKNVVKKYFIYHKKKEKNQYFITNHLNYYFYKKLYLPYLDDHKEEEEEQRRENGDDDNQKEEKEEEVMKTEDYLFLNNKRLFQEIFVPNSKKKKVSKKKKNEIESQGEVQDNLLLPFMSNEQIEEEDDDDDIEEKEDQNKLLLFEEQKIILKYFFYEIIFNNTYSPFNSLLDDPSSMISDEYGDQQQNKNKNKNVVNFELKTIIQEYNKKIVQKSLEFMSQNMKHFPQTSKPFFEVFFCNQLVFPFLINYSRENVILKNEIKFVKQHNNWRNITRINNMRIEKYEHLKSIFFHNFLNLFFKDYLMMSTSLHRTTTSTSVLGEENMDEDHSNLFIIFLHHIIKKVELFLFHKKSSLSTNNKKKKNKEQKELTFMLVNEENEKNNFEMNNLTKTFCFCLQFLKNNFYTPSPPSSSSVEEVKTTKKLPPTPPKKKKKKKNENLLNLGDDDNDDEEEEEEEEITTSKKKEEEEERAPEFDFLIKKIIPKFLKFFMNINQQQQQQQQDDDEEEIDKNSRRRNSSKRRMRRTIRTRKREINNFSIFCILDIFKTLSLIFDPVFHQKILIRPLNMILFETCLQKKQKNTHLICQNSLKNNHYLYLFFLLGICIEKKEKEVFFEKFFNYNFIKNRRTYYEEDNDSDDNYNNEEEEDYFSFIFEKILYFENDNQFYNKVLFNLLRKKLSYFENLINKNKFLKKPSSSNEKSNNSNQNKRVEYFELIMTKVINVSISKLNYETNMNLFLLFKNRIIKRFNKKNYLFFPQMTPLFLHIFKFLHKVLKNSFKNKVKFMSIISIESQQQQQQSPSQQPAPQQKDINYVNLIINYFKNYLIILLKNENFDSKIKLNCSFCILKIFLKLLKNKFLFNNFVLNEGGEEKVVNFRIQIMVFLDYYISLMIQQSTSNPSMLNLPKKQNYSNLISFSDQNKLILKIILNAFNAFVKKEYYVHEHQQHHHHQQHQKEFYPILDNEKKIIKDVVILNLKKLNSIFSGQGTTGSSTYDENVPNMRIETNEEFRRLIRDLKKDATRRMKKKIYVKNIIPTPLLPSHDGASDGSGDYYSKKDIKLNTSNVMDMQEEKVKRKSVIKLGFLRKKK